jgi:hypothetical protein
MKFIITAMHDEYGKSRWNRMSQEDQLNAIAEFMANYVGALKFINSK